MEKEQTYYIDTPSVRVNNDFAIFNNQWRVKIKNIDVAFVTKVASNRRWPITFGVIFCLLGLIPSLTVCLIIGIILFVTAFLIPTKYVLRIKTGTGEIRPLTSTKKSELEEIQQAIEKAIINSSEKP